MSAFGKQVDGDHYTKLKIQPLVYAEQNKLTPAEFCVVKHVTRHRHKGEGYTDLCKARDYINKMIEMYYPMEDAKARMMAEDTKARLKAEVAKWGGETKKEVKSDNPEWGHHTVVPAPGHVYANPAPIPGTMADPVTGNYRQVQTNSPSRKDTREKC